MLLFVGYTILHYINTFKQNKDYEETSTDETTVVNSHSNELPYKFAVHVKTSSPKGNDRSPDSKSSKYFE